MDYYDDVITTKKMKNYGFDILGEDLLLEILLKLDVKTVLRCHSVSKTWYDLTKTADFITRHGIQHQPSDGDRKHCMMFLNLQLGFSMFVDEEESISVLRYPFFDSFVKDVKEIFVIGSCNGLIYLNVRVKIHRKVCRGTVYRQMIVVWNPVTEQYRILPKPNTKDTSISFNKDEEDDIVRVKFASDNSCVPLLGFGFVDDEYKVARIFCHRDNVFRAQVFVPSTNSWIAVKNALQLANLCFSCPETSVMLNGVLYWKVVRGDVFGFRDVCIMSFDLRDESFGVIEIPTCLQGDSGGGIRLYSWRNSLAFFTRDYEMMWVMNNNNKSSAWNLQFTFGDNVLRNARECLGFWKNDEFLLTRNSDDTASDKLLPDVPNGVISYNLETHTEKHIINIIKHKKENVQISWSSKLCTILSSRLDNQYTV